jgi:response regulator RpfG family c-di-GMP phosphodiesterase
MRILYVDHNPNICEQMTAVLGKKFQVDAVPTAEQALSLMTQEDKFAAVIATNDGGKGLAFLTLVSYIYPLTKRVLLAGGGFMAESIHRQAITKGHISRYYQTPYTSLHLLKDLVHDLSPARLPTQ